MNTISHDGQSFAFATVSELLALPVVRKFLEDPQFQDWAYDCFTIYAVDSTPIMHLVGVVKERVVLPKSICGGRPA